MRFYHKHHDSAGEIAVKLLYQDNNLDTCKAKNLQSLNLEMIDEKDVDIFPQQPQCGFRTHKVGSK